MKWIQIAGCVLFSILFVMCSGEKQKKTELTKKQEKKIYYERLYAESIVDSTVDAIIPLKKELENKLDGNTPNIEAIRKQYQSEYAKWINKKQELMDNYNNEILRKYDISDETYNQVCKKMSMEINESPGRKELIMLINEGK